MEIKTEYVLEAKRIIKTYHQTIENVNLFTSKIEKTRADLLNMQKDVEQLHSTSGTDLQKHQEAYQILLKYENTTTELQKMLQPHVDALEKIKKEAQNLYKMLLDKYPMYNEKQLQEQIFKQLDEEKSK